MIDLKYNSRLSYRLLIPACKVGKEGIDQSLRTLIKKQEDKGVFCGRWSFITNNNEIVWEYSGAPFANLSFQNRLTISDTSITYTYEEKTDQPLMLPNISMYVNILLMSIKVAETVNGPFDDYHMESHIEIDNNTECYFYEKYSPLDVEYAMMLKYKMDNESKFDIDIESNDDVYLLINRFYQLFKCAQSVNNPYVTVSKDSFKNKYNGLE